MALDTHGRFFCDKPERRENPEGGEKTDLKSAKQSEQADKVPDYPRKKSLVDRAACDTKNSVLFKYGEVFDREQLQRIQDEVVPEKYEVYNGQYFVEEKLANVPLNERAYIVGIHGVKDHEIGIKDTGDLIGMRHTTTHETMHSLSYQKRFYEQGNGRWGEIEHIDCSKKKDRSGIREITYDESEGKVEDANRRLNEGITEMYTLREIMDRGEVPGLQSYTKEVGWAMQLEECVGAETLSRAYFGGDLDGLRSAVNELGEDDSTWDGLSSGMDRHAQLEQSVARYLEMGDFDAAKAFAMERELCRRRIEETLFEMNRRRRERAGYVLRR